MKTHGYYPLAIFGTKCWNSFSKAHALHFPFNINVAAMPGRDETNATNVSATNGMQKSVVLVEVLFMTIVENSSDPLLFVAR